MIKVFHHNDADGRLSAYWIKKILTKPMEFYEEDYSRPFPMEEVTEKDVVYIVDYSIEPEEMKLLQEKVKDVVWIDHHISSIIKYNDYHESILGIRVDGIAACSLTYLFLKHKLELMTCENIDEIRALEEKEVPEFCKLVADRDVWTWKYGNKTTYFNLALQSYDTSPDGVWELFENDPKLINSFLAKGVIIKNYRDAWAKEYLEKYYFDVEFEGYKCIAWNIGHCGSEYFDSVKDKKYDILIPFVCTKDKVIFSLYTERDDLDVSKIAEKYKGGGHRAASGMSVSHGCSCPVVPWIVR